MMSPEFKWSIEQIKQTTLFRFMVLMVVVLVRGGDLNRMMSALLVGLLVIGLLALLRLRSLNSIYNMQSVTSTIRDITVLVGHQQAFLQRAKTCVLKEPAHAIFFDNELMLCVKKVEDLPLALTVLKEKWPHYQLVYNCNKLEGQISPEGIPSLKGENP